MMVKWLKIIVLVVWGLLFHAGACRLPAIVETGDVAGEEESYFSKLELPQKAYHYIHYLYIHTSCTAAETGTFEQLSKADCQVATHVGCFFSDVSRGKESFRGFSYWLFHPIDYFVYFLCEILI